MTIETKFDAEDKCYYMQDNKIKEDNVKSVHVIIGLNALYAYETIITYYTYNRKDPFKEAELFHTIKELINELLK